MYPYTCSSFMVAGSMVLGVMVEITTGTTAHLRSTRHSLTVTSVVLKVLLLLPLL